MPHTDQGGYLGEPPPEAVLLRKLSVIVVKLKTGLTDWHGTWEIMGKIGKGLIRFNRQTEIV